MSRDGRAATDRAAMDAADPAGREDRDPGRVGRDHRRADGRGGPTAGGQRGGEARPGDLADRAGRRRRERLEIRVRQADEETAVVDGHGRRDGARLAHRRLRRAGDLDVLRVWQAVADEGRLEGHDRRAAAEGVGHFGRQVEAVADAAVGHGRSVPDAVAGAADEPFAGWLVTARTHPIPVRYAWVSLKRGGRHDLRARHAGSEYLAARPSRASSPNIGRGGTPGLSSRPANIRPRYGTAAAPCGTLSGCRAPAVRARGGGRRPDGPPASRGGVTRRPARRSGGPRATRPGSRHRTRRRRPVVSDANSGRVAMSERIGVEPSPRARIDAPCAPRLMTTTGAKASSPSSAHPPSSASASPAVANRRSGATDRKSACAAFWPAASNGPLDARSTLIAAPFIRASWAAHRPAEPRGSPEQRVGRQVQHVDAAEPGRLEIATRQRVRRAPIGDEGALGTADHVADGRDDDADPARRQAPDPGRMDDDPVPLERVDERPADAVAAHRADELDPCPEPAEPSRGTRRRAALAEHHPAGYVRAADHRLRRRQDRIEHQVAEDHHGGSLRSPTGDRAAPQPTGDPGRAARAAGCRWGR